jgi:Cu/Ag efflux pump CusA
MGGTITSTFLTLLVVPLLYYKMMRKKYPESSTPTNNDGENTITQ